MYFLIPLFLFNINLNLYNKNVFYSIKFKFIELKNENRTYSPAYWTRTVGSYRVQSTSIPYRKQYLFFVNISERLRGSESGYSL